MAAITLGTQALALQQGTDHWQTMVFTVLSLAQLGHVLAIRSEHDFLAKQGIFSNLPLLGSVLLTALLQMVVIYWPVANEIFRTKPLSWTELLFCVGGAALLFHAVELEKWILRRKR
jgi:Ca2+-transporting ATPase